jgi:hypothetical protein
VADRPSDLFGKVDALLAKHRGEWPQAAGESATDTSEPDYPLLTDVYALPDVGAVGTSEHPGAVPPPEATSAETAAPAYPPRPNEEALYQALERRLSELAEKKLVPELTHQVDDALGQALAQIHVHIGVALRQAISEALADALSTHGDAAGRNPQEEDA